MKGLLKSISYLLCAGLVLAGLNAAARTEPEAVPGEFVIKLKDQYTLTSNKSSLNLLAQQLGAVIKTTIPSQNIVVIKRPVFELRASVVKIISNQAMVETVEPNYIYRINKAPNDPLYPQLWGMNNTGQKDSEAHVGAAGVDIGVQAAWDIETGSKNVLVAVIDTGILYDSPELKDNVWTNEAEANGKTGVDDDSNGFIDDIHGYNFVNNTGDPLDDHGHGSHCSGTIGAKGNDGAGLVGINWNVRIMGIKFLDKDGSGSLDNALKAIDYATKMGAKIMSNSWGGAGGSDTLKAAIDRSNAAGALFVVAAGNDGTNNDSTPSYPGSYDTPNILTVAAVDNQGALASFSNVGRNSVHVAAPGVNILSVTTAGFESWSGTSMATPHVSGIAALLAAHEPNLTNLELKNRIIATAKPLPSLRGKVRSGGMANAFTALTNVQVPPDENDPANWPQSLAVNISSAHPYAANADETYNVSVPGAKQISVYFAKFYTETKFDTVAIYDSKGNLVQTLSGINDDTFSAIIDGDSAKIVFKADNSIERDGFDITKVSYR